MAADASAIAAGSGAAPSNTGPMEASSGGSKGHGWAAFAATMVLIVGVFNVIYGLAAIIEDDYFLADQLLFGDLSFWGWVHLIIGVAQVITAMLIFGGNNFGAVLGIMFAGFNAIAALLAIGAYPVWSVIILVIDGLVIYALTVYGDAFREA
jgi:hypothetical protein